MSASMSAVARRLISIAASITTVARNLGPNAPRSTPAGSSARVCVPHTRHATFSNSCSVVTTADAGRSITWWRAARPTTRSCALSSCPHLRHCSGRTATVSSGSSMSLRDAPSCPGWAPCLRSERLRTGRLGPCPRSLDGGSELLTEFWPNRRSSFSSRSRCSASSSPCSATASNNRSIRSRAGSPPPNAICSASSRRSSTLHNYAPIDKNPANRAGTRVPERVRHSAPLGHQQPVRLRQPRASEPV